MINLEDHVVILYEVFSLSSLLYYYLSRHFFLISSNALYVIYEYFAGK